jgi:hypothetical protein
MCGSGRVRDPSRRDFAVVYQAMNELKASALVVQDDDHALGVTRVSGV